MYREAKRFIQEAIIGAKTETLLVATHHVPTYLHYPEQYRGSLLSEAFATELQDLIAHSPIDYWIYGHHHHNTPAFQIGKATLLTNQLGYVRHGEEKGYQPSATITIA
jgi:hypothetical protein